MAALGAIGLIPTAVKRLVPLPYTTPTGDVYARNARMRRILDVAEAQNIRTGYVRAIVQDFWRITQGRSAQYLSNFKQVRGTVKNSAGTGIARRVVITNGFGQCVGRVTSAADGTFSILCDNNNDAVVLCQALPEDGDLRNAVVAWKVIPVTAV